MKKLFTRTAILFTVCCALSFNAEAVIHTVQVANFQFTPNAINNVAVGDTVRWIWVSGLHTSTSTVIPGAAAPWDFSIISAGSFDYKATVAGVYNYQCTPHLFTGSFRVGLPIADFFGNPTTICAGNSVTFTDASTGNPAPNAWQWTFSGGTPASSALQNPVVNYSVAGTYNVKLVVSNANGSDSLTKNNYITIDAIPVVNLGADVTQCGGTVMLDAGNAGSTYAWSTAAITQTINVSSSGTYSVVVTNSCGSSSDTVTVTINAAPAVNLGADVTQCGGSVMLDAGNAGSTYMWSDASTTQTITVSSTGNYSVTVTNANGCTGTDAAMVTINTPPAVNLGADVTQCGGSVMLDAGNAGSAYMWSDASTNQTLTVSASGTYSVVATNSCGSSSDTIIVTINPLPAITTSGNTTICSGSSVTLCASGGASYLWSSGQTTNCIVISPTVTTSYTVTGTDANGCSASAAVMVTINPLPAITAGSNVTICSGNCTTLFASGGVTYVWSPAGGLSNPNIPNPVSCPTASTSYTVTGTDANGCSNTAIVTVNIGAGPSVSATSTSASCPAGSDGTATANPSGGTPPYNYLWTGGQTTQTVTGLVPGNYTVTVTDAGGCSSMTSVVVSSGSAAQVQTIFTGGNGQDGNMFDITAITNIQITSFEGNIDDAAGGGAGGNMEIYYRAGTHVGNENNAGAWTLIGNAFVDPVSTGAPTVIPIPVNINIPAGQSYGFYITGNNTGDDVDYTDGTNFGNPAAQDANIQILEGRGNAYPFGTAYPTAGPPGSRIWNGIVHYCTGPVGAEEENGISTMRGVNVYPNPSTGMFNVEFLMVRQKDGLSQSGSDGNTPTIEIHNVLGEKVFTSSINHSRRDSFGATTLTINLNVPAGIYFYKVTDAGGTVGTGKIMIE